MEKLSGILPSRPRLKSVDMSTAHPVRPGVPAYGRPLGSTALERDRVSLSEQARQLAEASQQAVATPMAQGRKPSELTKAQIADSLSRQFFDTRLNPVVVETPTSEILESAFKQGVEQQPVGLESGDLTQAS